MNILVLASRAGGDCGWPTAETSLSRVLVELGHRVSLQVNASSDTGFPFLLRSFSSCLRARPSAIHALEGTADVARHLAKIFGARLVESPLPGVSLLGGEGLPARSPTEGSLSFLYVGPLGRPHGTDLLLDSFSLHHRKRRGDKLVVSGGSPRDVAALKNRAQELGCANSLRFAACTSLPDLLRETDVLVSPALRGATAPFLLPTLLDSGRPVLVTRTTGHARAASETECHFADATPEQLAEGMRKLAGSPELRARLAASAKARAAACSLAAYKSALAALHPPA